MVYNEIIKIMNNKLTEALNIFRKQYPSITSADLQTFILGWEACQKMIIENQLIPKDTINYDATLVDNCDHDTIPIKVWSHVCVKCGFTKYENPDFI